MFGLIGPAMTAGANYFANTLLQDSSQKPKPRPTATAAPATIAPPANAPGIAPQPAPQPLGRPANDAPKGPNRLPPQPKHNAATLSDFHAKSHAAAMQQGNAMARAHGNQMAETNSAVAKTMKENADRISRGKDRMAQIEIARINANAAANANRGNDSALQARIHAENAKTARTDAILRALGYGGISKKVR